MAAKAYSMQDSIPHGGTCLAAGPWSRNPGLSTPSAAWGLLQRPVPVRCFVQSARPCRYAGLLSSASLQRACCGRAEGTARNRWCYLEYRPPFRRRRRCSRSRITRSRCCARGRRRRAFIESTRRSLVRAGLLRTLITKTNVNGLAKLLEKIEELRRR